MEIRLFKCEEEKDLQQAIHELWAPGHRLSIDRTLLRHMFYESPAHREIADEEEYSFIGVWLKDEIIGLLGIIPYYFNENGKRSWACALTNWTVREEYRHTGAGFKLMDWIQQKNPSLILSLGISEMAVPIYKMMRWDVTEDITRWIGLVDKTKSSEVFLDGDCHALRYFDKVKKIEDISLQTMSVLTLDEVKWDTFYQKLSKNLIGMSREYSFLKWRYFNHPSFEYHTIICSDEQDYHGICILRVEEIEGGFKIGRIVEMLYDSQNSAVALANAVVDFADDLLFVDCYMTSSQFMWGLELVGFRKVLKTEEDLYVLPTRFQPIDLHVTSMAAAIYLPATRREKYNLLKMGQLYITKGDSDQDRPN